MKFTILAAWMAVGANALAADTTSDEEPVQTPSDLPMPDVFMSQGCYNATGTWTLNKKIKTYRVSSGECGKYCTDDGATAFGMQGSKCMCGDDYPPVEARVDDSKCNFGCPGYPLEACGGLGDPGFWSVFNGGTELNVQHAKPKEEEEDDDEGDDDSPSTSGSDSQTSAAETGAVDTAAPTESGDAGKSKDDGPNIGAIAAGVVVGVVLVAAGIGALFFFMRRRRNTEIEEEHRRNAAVNAFISGSKPPGSSGSISMTDSRLDPIMAHRRLSDGSIADNQDYSRKILRVTNA